MNIELHKSFLEKMTHSNDIKYYKNLDEEEKEIFINFLREVLEDKALPGKNKSSAEPFKNTDSDKNKNYSNFLANDIRHYHLGSDDSISENLKYTVQGANLKSYKIEQLNSIPGEFKTCDNLLNYKLLSNDRIIIYNISKHKVWTELVDYLKNDQAIMANYTVCMNCIRLKIVGQNLPVASLMQCKCTETTSTVVHEGISEQIGISSSFTIYHKSVINNTIEVTHSAPDILNNTYLIKNESDLNDLINKNIL